MRMSIGDARWASPWRLLLALTNQFSIAMLGHPTGASEMGFMNRAATLGIAIRIETKQNMHRLAPVSTIAVGVEQSHIELHVLAIVRCERFAERWFVQKRLHRLSHQATIVARVLPVNHLR